MQHAAKRKFLPDYGWRSEMRSEMTPERRRSARERMLTIAEENEEARSASASDSEAA